MTERTSDEAVLKSWIGRSQTRTDSLNANQARLMQATLDLPVELNTGDPLPALWHWIYFPEGGRLSELGRDGHSQLGGFLPPVALPRRMWAGGRVTFETPLVLGEVYTRTSIIQDVTAKQGRSGELCFVTVRHDIADRDQRIAVREEHDIVYREDPKPGSKPPPLQPPPADFAYTDTVTPSAVMMFRYSALTFNGHRIHYDRPYSCEVEGYPGLVFHGPLTATLLAGLAVKNNSDGILDTFSFRALAPLFDDKAFEIRGIPNPHEPKVQSLWAETPDGGLAMSATATFRQAGQKDP